MAALNSLTTRHWSPVVGHSDQQLDGNSCALFALRNIFILGLGPPPGDCTAASWLAHLSLGYTGLLSFARQEFDPWTPLQTSSICLLGIGPSGDVPQSYELLPTLPLLCRFALWVDSRLHPCAEFHVYVFVYYRLCLVHCLLW